MVANNLCAAKFFYRNLPAAYRHTTTNAAMKAGRVKTAMCSKTRLAPTPSGYLHLGNVLSFVLTAALARRTAAAILLRIDDLDKARATPAYLQDIFDTLLFLGLPWHEGPKTLSQFTDHFSQQRRMHLYEDALQHLKQSPHIFACTCSRLQIQQQSKDGGYPGTCCAKGLPLDTPGAAWRVHTPPVASLRIRTFGADEAVVDLPASVRYFVVRKRDGMAAYQLSSVVDDLYFGTDLIVRGADLWPSTLAQLYLSRLLPQNNFTDTTFVHHPLLLDAQGQKLSKSAGAGSVFQLRKAGKSSAEIYEILAGLCGINTPVPNWQTLAAALERIGFLGLPLQPPNG